jgi:hypothetical protein
MDTKTQSQFETEIRECFERMGTCNSKEPFPLAAQGSLIDRWGALSQYGCLLAEGFTTQAEAEQFTLNHYSVRMNLIRQ